MGGGRTGAAGAAEVVLVPLGRGTGLTGDGPGVAPRPRHLVRNE